MAKVPLIGILLLVLAAALVWLLSDHAPEPTAAPPAPALAPETQPATAEDPATAAELPPDAAEVADPAASERTEVATGLAIVGQVVDDAGRPVEGATVTGTTTPTMPGGRGNRGGGTPGFDFANGDLADFDLNDLLERFRTQQRERVQVTTDGEGHFRLLPVGGSRDVFLRVAARGYLLLNRSARRPLTGDVDLGSLPLQRGAVVSGRVVDRQVLPIAGAKVARRRNGEGRMGFELEFPGADLLEELRDGDGGVTDADGRFELAHVTPGEFSLRARHSDHPIAHLDGLTVAAGETLSDVLVVVEPGASIQGTVVDVPAGTRGLRVQASDRQGSGSGSGSGAGQQGGRMDLTQLLGNASGVLAELGLAVGEKSVELEADGSFALRGLRVGRTYRLWIAQTARGFVGSGACSEPTDVAAGTVGVEIRYDPGITVTCRVVEADTDTPVERLFVSHRLQGGSGGLKDLVSNFMPGGGRAKDYPDGRVTVTDLRPSEKQTLRLSIQAVGYGTLVREGVALPNSGNLDLGTLPLTRTPVLEVQVTATDDGLPLAGVAVRLQAPRDRGRGGNPFAAMGNFAGRRGDGPLSGRTDAAGRCVLNSLPGTTATLTVESPEHAPYEAAIALPAEENATHAARLLRGGRVEVTLLDAEGEPLLRTRVEHAPPNGRRDTKTTDADGLAVFERLAPGAHRFSMGQRRGRGGDLAAMAARFGGGASGGDDAGWTTVEVIDGVSSELELTKSLTASLRGIVRDNGVPLASARISFLKGPAGSEADTPQGRMAGAFAGMGGRGSRTGDDGSYAMKELPAGQHRLRITHRSRTMPATVELALRLGDNVIDVNLQTTVLRGTVRDPEGQPIAGATISVRQSGSGADPLSQLAQGSGFDLRRMGGRRGGVTTGADGTFELRGVADGVPLLVTASAKGLASGTAAPVQLTAGGVQEGVDVQLSAAGSIEVTASGGGMLRAVRATLLAADGNPEPGAAPRLQMLRRGSGTIEGVRPGRYRVEMMGTNGPSGEPVFVEVVAGATAKVAL